MFDDTINSFYFVKSRSFFQHRTAITAFGRKKKEKKKTYEKLVTHNENMQFFSCH